MNEHIGGHLPVYKVHLIGENTRFRVLYRNLLFPLAMRNESDEKQQNMEEKEPKLTDQEEENDASLAVHVDKNVCGYFHTELVSIPVILYCSDLFRGERMTRSLVLNLQFSTASGVGIVVKGYRLVKFFHIEIIGKYYRKP